MNNKNYKLDIVPGIVIALLSIAYLLIVPSIQVFEGLGSTPLTNRFVPYLWGGVLLVLSVWIIIRGVIKYRRFKAEGGAAEKTSLKTALWERREVVASFIALAVYVALMGVIGFAIMTILYVFVQILILTPREKWKKTYLPAGITSVVAGIVLYYIFKYLLNVLLPSGILSIIGL